jgi:hypothetical protein
MRPDRQRFCAQAQIRDELTELHLLVRLVLDSEEIGRVNGDKPAP